MNKILKGKMIARNSAVMLRWSLSVFFMALLLLSFCSTRSTNTLGRSSIGNDLQAKPVTREHCVNQAKTARTSWLHLPNVVGQHTGGITPHRTSIRLGNLEIDLRRIHTKYCTPVVPILRQQPLQIGESYGRRNGEHKHKDTCISEPGYIESRAFPET